MAHETLATTATPALIIYVLDLSLSMAQPLGSRRRIDVVTDALNAALRQMVFRSTKGGHISPRYRVGLFAYSDRVLDAFDGIRPIDRIAQLQVPELTPLRTTDTARAFGVVESVLEAELPSLANCPAPVVCHMTDGEFTGGDPEPIVRRIMQMQVADGNVLVENIFVSDKVLPGPTEDPQRWPGVLPTTALPDEYARKLQRLSSPLPESYRGMMQESGYRLAPGALMLLPGLSAELVSMGFQMSASTRFR